MSNPALAFVISRFNEPIIARLLQGAKNQLAVHGTAWQDEHAFWVPGAVEIPLIAQHLAQTGNYQAIVCLGAVIRGETSHYEAVCQQVSEGCQWVRHQYRIPVVFGILTTENQQQAMARSGGDHSDMGAYAVDTAYEMIKVIHSIEQQSA